MFDKVHTFSEHFLTFILELHWPEMLTNRHCNIVFNSRSFQAIAQRPIQSAICLVFFLGVAKLILEHCGAKTEMVERTIPFYKGAYHV